MQPSVKESSAFAGADKARKSGHDGFLGMNFRPFQIGGAEGKLGRRNLNKAAVRRTQQAC